MWPWHLKDTKSCKTGNKLAVFCYQPIVVLPLVAKVTVGFWIMVIFNPLIPMLCRSALKKCDPFFSDILRTGINFLYLWANTHICSMCRRAWVCPSVLWELEVSPFGIFNRHQLSFCSPGMDAVPKFLHLLWVSWSSGMWNSARDYSLTNPLSSEEMFLC